jgi:DNA transformation protein
MKSPPLADLRNLGPTSVEWLSQVGVRTVADLRRLGPVVAFRLVKARFPQATVNMLWALAAGLDGRDWRELTDADKVRLRQELDEERA